MNKDESIMLLTAHKENLKIAKTFEEFRDRQIEYIDTLLATYEKEKERTDVLQGFVDLVWRNVDAKRS